MSGKTVHTIRLVGGHVALDLINTVDAGRDRRGPDAFVTYTDAANWAVRVGLIDPALGRRLLQLAADNPLEASAALARLVAAREMLHGIFVAEVEGRAPGAAVRDALSSLITEAMSSRTLVHRVDGFAWGWSNGDLDAVLQRAVFAAAELLAEAPNRRRISECTASNCGWLFLDTSRAGRRRWCSDESCGTHSRVRRFRAKALPRQA